MNKYTKAILTTAIALCVLALPVKADEVMECGAFVFRLERNLFSSDVISIRYNSGTDPVFRTPDSVTNTQSSKVRRWEQNDMCDFFIMARSI